MIFPTAASPSKTRSDWIFEYIVFSKESAWISTYPLVIRIPIQQEHAPFHFGGPSPHTHYLMQKDTPAYRLYAKNIS